MSKLEDFQAPDAPAKTPTEPVTASDEDSSGQCDDASVQVAVIACPPFGEMLARVRCSLKQIISGYAASQAHPRHPKQMVFEHAYHQRAVDIGDRVREHSGMGDAVYAVDPAARIIDAP